MENTQNIQVDLSQITLIPLTDAHLPLMHCWLYKAHIAPWYTHPQAWIYEIENRATAFSFITHQIVLYQGYPIGFCQYYSCQAAGEIYRDIPIKDTYSLDYLIGEENYLGHNIGKKIAALLIAQISAIPQAARIAAQPSKENLRSCHVLLANGFVYDQANEAYLLTL